MTLTILVAALLVSSPGPGPAQPASTGPGTIVFTSNRDGDFDLYAVNPDGTGLTQLTRNQGQEDSGAVPSPDGSLIAFYNSRLDATVMNADGSGRHKLRGCSSFDAWAPDSTKFLCGTSGLSIVDVASGAATPLTQSGSDAAWSPDGRTIAYRDGGRLWVIPAAGGTRRRIGNREPSRPTWSPDSQRIAYGSSVRRGRAYRLVLFAVSPDGSGERPLVEGVDENSPPRWSPDGSLLAFTMHPPRAAGDFTDIYTVQADGTGLQRVTASQGGETSGQPEWSPDGTELVYTRSRYRDAEDTDVFVISPGAGTRRALTQPFPMGGSNSEARWRVGPPVTGTPPTPRTVTLPFVRQETIFDPVERLAADGRRAFAYSEDSCQVQVWNSRTGHAMRTPKLCYGETVGSMVLAGKRLALVVYLQSNTEFSSDLYLLRLGARRVTGVTTTILYSEGGGQGLGSLVGNGDTIAFTVFTNPGTRREGRRPWLLVPRNGRKCPVTDESESETPKRLCRPLTSAAGELTASVDAGRILTATPGGVAHLLSPQGRVLRRWRLGRIVAAEIGGRTLATERGTSVTAYDTTSGAKRQTRPMAAGEGLPPYLLDVRGDLVAYVTGGAIHILRLSDGNDVALDIPGAAPPFDAKFSGGGLFVSWNQMYTRHPGRLAFAALRSIG